MKSIPFQEAFWELIRSGVKTMTTRSRSYGDPGDELETPVGVVELLAVERVTLQTVRDVFWSYEGVASPEDFELVWERLHPGRGFRAYDLGYLHEFWYRGRGTDGRVGQRPVSRLLQELEPAQSRQTATKHAIAPRTEATHGH